MGSAGNSSDDRGLTGFALYTSALFTIITCLPKNILHPGSTHVLFAIGYLAAWRYGWGLVHYIRHLIYRLRIFPRLRCLADPWDNELMPSHVYLLITSYRIDAETTTQVYNAAILEAIQCRIPTTIIASIVEKADETLIGDIYSRHKIPDHVKLNIVRIAGTGKRDALAQGFRAISRDLPQADAVVAVIDGDSVIEKNLIRKCVPFFKTVPNLGALTTDEICEVRGSRLIREWHNLRFAQRQVLMCSMGLSKKVLTLTGRMSMFRADIIINGDFIDTVQNDTIEHWRLGNFRLLTGDDKSSWFWLLKNDWKMLYVPDTVVMTVEHPPHENFFHASTMLMFRWFGNMLRTNSRVLAMGPRKVGFFTWWCVLDQRISMWTSLSGPVFALFLTFSHSILFLPAYFIWIAFTRWIMCLMLLGARPQTSALYPFLLYYNQIWGSLVKTYVFFRLDRQSWTRQKTKLSRNLTANEQRWQKIGSAATHGIAVLVFLCLIGMASGVLELP